MTKLLWLQSALFFTTHLLLSQNIGHFVSVKPLNTQPDSFIIPTTHTFQYLLKNYNSRKYEHTKIIKYKI